MENIVKGTDMKKIDSYTINEIGIPSLVLMERAAKSVADLIDKNERKQKNILHLSGEFVKIILRDILYPCSRN